MPTRSTPTPRITTQHELLAAVRRLARRFVEDGLRTARDRGARGAEARATLRAWVAEDPRLASAWARGSVQVASRLRARFFDALDLEAERLLAARARPNPGPHGGRRDPWRMTLAEFLGDVKVHRDFGPWSSDFHLPAAKHYRPDTLRVLAHREEKELLDGSTVTIQYATAAIRGEPGNVALLERWSNDPRWHPVGAYRGWDLGLLPYVQGKGLGAELVLATAILRGGRTGDTALSPAGLAAHRRAHQLSVRRALAQGLPVPRRVLDELRADRRRKDSPR